MKPLFNRWYICNYFFAAGLLLLLINDHLLKATLTNDFTGKLSDVAGLFILPLFLRFLLPVKSGILCAITALVFLFWKSPLAEGFIATWNKAAPFAISRVPDATDLFALLILPFSYILMQRIGSNDLPKRQRISLSPVWLLLPASFAFVATTVVRLPTPEGDVYIGKNFGLRMSKQMVLDTLQALGYAVRPDTSVHNRDDYYVIDNVVLGRDTIRSIQFRLTGGASGKQEANLFVNHVNLRGRFRVSDWRELKRYAKQYEKLIGKEMIVALK